MMKKVLNIFAVLTLVAVGMVSTASAQRTPVSTKTKVDFDFYVGDKQMPAGEYRIRLMPASSQSHKLIVIEQIGGDARAIVPSVPEYNKANLKPGSVKFNRYGGTYFLAGVQLGDESLFQTAIRSRTERETDAKIAGNSAKGGSGVVTEVHF